MQFKAITSAIIQEKVVTTNPCWYDLSVIIKNFVVKKCINQRVVLTHFYELAINSLFC